MNLDKENIEKFNNMFSVEMENSFNNIVEIIKEVDPCEIIEYLSIIAYLSNNTSGENEFLQPSQIEFICGIILAQKYEGEYKKFTPEKIQAFLDNIYKYFAGWSMSNYSRRLVGVNDEKEAEKQLIIASLAAKYGIVRGDAHAEQIKSQVYSLFKQYDDWMLSNQGFTIEDAIKYIDAIVNRYNKLLLEYRNELFNQSKDLIDDIYNKLSIDEDASKGSKQVKNFMKKYNSKKGKEELLGLTVANLFEVSYNDILSFDIETFIEEEGISDKERFISFINRFCSEINGGKNTKFKYPTDDNVFRQRPIIKKEDRYIVPNPMNLIWIIQYEIENDMKNDEIWDSYQKQKGNFLEKEVLETFKDILPNCKTYDSLYYYIKDDEGTEKQCELDALVIYDNNIFLIESKSGLFKVPARRGAIKALETAIYENIEYAFEQASRAKNYIIGNKIVKFLNADNSEKVSIDSSNYSNIYLINATLENFGEVATSIHKFKNVGLYKYNEYPWSININDLKVIAEFIEFPSQFIHYIHRRLKINTQLGNGFDIMTSDELDLLGNYLDTNLFYDDEKENTMIAIQDYSQYYNEYYYAKKEGKSVEKFQQKMDSGFKNILLDLEKLNQHGYTDIVVRLLELDGDTRKQISDSLKMIGEKTTKDRGIHDATMIVLSNPKDAQTGLGITVMTGLSKDRESLLKKLESYCKLKKYQQRVFEWIGLGKLVDDLGWTVNEFFYFKWEETYNDEKEKISNQILIKPMTWVDKVGRNDKCPCGSGKKFKKCHGK